MALQLVLRLDPPADDWRLDEHTREVGLRGLAQARRALARSGSSTPPEQPAPQERPHAA